MPTSSPNTPGRSLPHGYPFLFIDRVLEVDPGARSLALKNLSADTPWAAAPAPFLIEMCAQAAGIAAAANRTPPPQLRLAAVRAFTLHAPVAPGMTLLIRARIEGRFGPLVQAVCRIESDSLPIADATLALAEPPHPPM